MFTALQQVDDHVKRLLNISRNVEDIDMQCQTISKLYFDIKEYGIAKSYIERYTKAKSHSESGFVLKANIHEHLKEYDFAYQCYDNLYNMFKRKNYIIKACECLLKSNSGEKWAKIWIEILEKEIPDSDLLMKMKSHFLGSLACTRERMDKLEIQMKNDKGNQFKREYFLILEQSDETINALGKCIEILNSYDILDDINAVRSCVKIFSNDTKLGDTLHKPIYCILLMALVKNRIKTCDYDCSTYLSKLYELLKPEQSECLMKQLKIQFLYYLISFAQELAIQNKMMTHDVIESFSNAYSSLLNNDVYTSENLLPKYVCEWLDMQFIYRQSIITHMINNAEDVPKYGFDYSWIKTITRLVWKSQDKEIKDILDSVISKSLVNTDSQVNVDIRCYVNINTDFNLIIWQLMCYLDAFSSEEKYNLNISTSAVLFINSLLNKLFPKLSLQTLHDRCPENICKVDIITFLLGTVLTYKNAQINYGMPVPFECFKTLFKVSDSTEKWWNATCDFLLNNKRNTSIGMMREYFKKGLEIIQVVDNNIPEYLKLQLGRSLAKFANETENYKEATFERSIDFLYSAIKSLDKLPQKKTCPNRSHSNQLSFSRQNQFISPFNSMQKMTLFDTFEVPNEIILKWRFEAYLCYIDWNLKLESLGEDVNLYELQDLVDSANSINSDHPSLDILKSKIYLSNALKITDVNMIDKFNLLIFESTKYATRCEEHLDFVVQSERDELEELLREHISAIEAVKESDYSLLNFSYVDESRNNNEKSSYSTLNDNQINLTYNNGYNGKLESDLASLDIFNEKLNEKMESCLQIVEHTECTTRTNKHDIYLLKSQSSNQNELISNLISKFENLNRKFDKFSILETNFDNVSKENIIIKQEMKSLHEIINTLENKNAELEMSYDKFRRSTRFKSLLDQEIKSLNIAIGNELSDIEEVVSNHLCHLDDMETKILNEFSRKPKKAHSKKYHVETNKGINICDISQFSRDKWECPSCCLNVNNDLLLCPACTTPKPEQSKANVLSNTMIKNTPISGFDLSIYSRDKWECPSCCLNVNNDLLLCPACTTSKPGQSKANVLSNTMIKSTPNSGFDLSIYSRDKWECPSCCLNVNNDLLLCQACTTPKPGQSKSIPNYELDKMEFNNPISINLSIYPRDKWECSTCNVKIDNNFALCPTCNSVKSHILKEIPHSKEDTGKIKFGFNSNQNSIIQEQKTSSKSCVDFKFGSSIIETDVVEVKEDDWKCECTTSNSNGRNQCIACGEMRLDDGNDSDVIFVSEPYVTKEQKERARLLMLPDHFYYYENLPDKVDNESDCENNIKAPVEVFSNESYDNDHPENFNPHYESIVDLPKVDIVTGEEGWNEIYSKRCKLFKFRDNQWVERGLGNMKILKSEDNITARLLMRREKVQKVCCNHFIIKNCPSFSPMGGSVTSVCWYANDFSDKLIPEKEYFAIRFKTEDDLTEFELIIGELQTEMKDTKL